ncbi:MAG: glycoside hydrolase family 3 C-terminal domain-containing protein [bacterium]
MSNISDNLPYRDASLPIETRVADLISRMTLEEKISQMVHSASAIPRLGIPAYNWWNECLHGVARAGIATVFPQAIGMAASWDKELLYKVATAISDEARAKHHEFARHNDRDIYKGLTFWSPNINIFRDPRWGRGHETYGEDPYLTGELAVSFIKGLQGDHPRYLKVVATAKHYAVHSGPEKDRHHFNAIVSKKDLYETYLPAFKKSVQEGKVASIMGAYNRTNGEPCCASKTLLQDILRDEWGFDGYVVSDCGAIDDIHAHHKVTNSPQESSAMAVKNGCELNCGSTYNSLLKAVSEGLITEDEINIAVTRLYIALFKLGMFDPEEMVPYAQIPYEVNDCAENRELALKMARESIVLLKNENNLLPLSKDLKSIAVIGPNANVLEVLLGNYNGIPSKYVTPLEGIRNKVSPNTKVYYTPGCDLVSRSKHGFSEAISMAERSDVVIMVMGFAPRLEGEEGEGEGDRTYIDLPGVQEELLKEIHETGKPIVLVLTNGSAVAINWAERHIPAIVDIWYPGEEGGTALADVLFGDYNPAGRLPVTFVKSLDQVPQFTDYSMKNRTYRYMKEEPLYPFGYGLSYTTFKYSNLKINSKEIAPTQNLDIYVDVENTGNRDGDEVVQVYVSIPDASIVSPIRSLQGFTRVHLKSGERRTIQFTLTPQQFAIVNEDGKFIVEPGRVSVSVGGGQPGVKGDTGVLITEFHVVGKATEVC